MGFDYTDLPKCRECILFKDPKGKFECAIHWRPGTGTKAGLPKEDGWECPMDSFEQLEYELNERSNHDRKRKIRKT